MKRIFKYLAVMAASAAAVGCYPDVATPEMGKLPDAEGLEVKIEVDQETNYVTFTMLTPGVVPMWIFGDQKVDKTENTRYAYTQNGVRLRFRDEGTHSVEVKAYNANGVSMGSVVKTFEMENTYRDPFDPSPYIKRLSREWIWNSEVSGHFGCGPDVNDPASWWSCGANEKADWSLYNDSMTFTEDGKYLFNPGEDGKVYVNAGFTALGTSPDGNDFLVDIPAYESTYTIENDWNEAGVEEVWLVLPKGKNLSYIPNQSIYDNPRFLITSLSTKEVKLSAANAPNGDGTISWLYNFVPAGSLGGDKDENKAAAWDASISANMWSQATPNMAFWFSGADWSGMTIPDNTFVNNGDGTYTITMPEGMGGDQWKGQVHFESTGLSTSAGKKYDFQIVLLSSDDHPGVTIKLSKEGDDNTFYCADRHVIAADEEFVYQLADVDGIDIESLRLTLDVAGGVAGSTLNVSKIIICEHQEDHVIGAAPAEKPLDPSSDANMWKNAVTSEVSFWFANNDWGQIADPAYTAGDNEYKLVMPEGIGGAQWQGQFIFNNTGIAISTDKTYDFQVTLSSSEDHPHVTVKPCYNNGSEDVNELLYEPSIALKAYEDYVYTKRGVKGTDIPDLKLVFDFGGAVGGSEVVISGITIQEHKD